jgi:hypothetical protein|tara:strand:- start:968 stop:1144 length:177 start_codon:yes stop_codon:yes gene_type:complete
MNPNDKLKFLEDSISELETLIVTMKDKEYSEDKIKQFEGQKFMMQNELYNLKSGRRND